LAGKELPPLSDLIVGGKYGQLRKRTLSNYCHNHEVTAKLAVELGIPNLQTGCPLFETKSDGLPEDLAHAIDTAEQFREFKELGINLELEDIGAYEFSCYSAADRAVRKINNEPDTKKDPSNEPMGHGRDNDPGWKNSRPIK
jgi:hypothetical protein